MSWSLCELEIELECAGQQNGQKSFSTSELSKRPHSSDTWLFKALLWRAMVMPMIEYASTVWNPCLISQVKELEKVQRRFTRLIRLSPKAINNQYNLPENRKLEQYITHLNAMHWEPLKTQVTTDHGPLLSAQQRRSAERGKTVLGNSRHNKGSHN